MKRKGALTASKKTSAPTTRKTGFQGKVTSLCSKPAMPKILPRANSVFAKLALFPFLLTLRGGGDGWMDAFFWLTRPILHFFYDLSSALAQKQGAPSFKPRVPP